MYIWNVIRAWFQERIQDMGVEETSFPMFLSAKSFEKVSTAYHTTTTILACYTFSWNGANFE